MRVQIFLYAMSITLLGEAAIAPGHSRKHPQSLPLKPARRMEDDSTPLAIQIEQLQAELAQKSAQIDWLNGELSLLRSDLDDCNAANRELQKQELSSVYRQLEQQEQQLLHGRLDQYGRDLEDRNQAIQQAYGDLDRCRAHQE